MVGLGLICYITLLQSRIAAKVKYIVTRRSSEHNIFEYLILYLNHFKYHIIETVPVEIFDTYWSYCIWENIREEKILINLAN